MFVQNPERPSGSAGDFSVPDWSITDVETFGGLRIISDGIDAIPSFVMRIHVERKHQYYVYTMITPLIVIVMMALVSFWIDPMNFAAQIGVASTSMLTVITYRVAAVQILPRTSYFTDMDKFIAGSTVIVFLILVVTVTTAMLSRSGQVELARSIDGIGRWLTPPLFAGVIWFCFA